jgi:predicted NBD/HSP70 family sugar kinase
MPDRIEAALISLTGEVIGHTINPIPQETRNRTDYETHLRRSVTAALSHTDRPVMGIGIAAAGMVDPDEGTIITMNLAPALDGFNLRAFMSAEFSLEADVDHHPRAILLGERWFGEGRGLNNFAVIYADEVLGCATYLDGKPFRGPHGSGGELGHTIVEIGGELCTCGKRGCWETVATLGWLRRTAAASGIPAESAQTIELLAKRAKTDDIASDVLKRYAQNIAVGLANLQTLMMPDNFVLYGGIRKGGAEMIGALEKRLADLAPSIQGNAMRIIVGQNEAATTLRGAAGLVISQKLSIEY